MNKSYTSLMLFLFFTLHGMEEVPYSRVQKFVEKIYAEYIPRLDRGMPVGEVLGQIATDLFSHQTTTNCGAIKYYFVKEYAHKLAQKNPRKIQFFNNGKLMETYVGYSNGTEARIIPSQPQKTELPKDSPWSQLSFDELIRVYAATISIEGTKRKSS